MILVLVLPRRLERAVALALPALGLHRIRKHTPINARQCARIGVLGFP